MVEDDDLLFTDDEQDEYIPVATSGSTWKILIVDDEPEIHQITKLTLETFKFENRTLEFLHAYSAKEALVILEEVPDIALTLLDVVMETNHAGLDLVKQIRDDMQNSNIRIVLRTGQPGVAPERDIIMNYDINDYVEKADLSAQKLFTIIVASLRGYRDILKLVDSQANLLSANKKLTEQSERIQVTLDSIGDAVLTTDAQGKITHLNPVAENLTGWNLLDAIGQDVRVVFPIVDASTRKTIANPIDKVLLTGEVVYLSNHTTLISKSGQEYQIADSAAPIRDNKQQILGMVLVCNDVTEQYRLREEAKRSRQNLQTIMDNSPAVIYAKDLEGRYIFINHQFETLFNAKSGDILGKTDLDVFPEQFAKQFIKNDKKVLALGEAIDSEEDVPIKSDIKRYLSTKFPLFNDKNEIFAVCGISSDVTERRAQEDQLRRAQKMEAMGQLTGGIAHDFNNQLGVVIGYLDLLAEFAEKDISAKKWVDVATRSVLRCTDLTRQLLSFSQTKTVEKSLVNVNDSLRELKTMFVRSMTPAIELEYLLAEKISLTEINAGEFQDAILNLVINARDAMPNGGTLLVETSNIYIDEDFVSANCDSKKGMYLHIVLSDTGIGMDKTTSNRVFEPFFTTKAKGKGTGLGMSMVYGFVKRSNGCINIDSELGKGTTIHLYLPQSESVAKDTIIETDKSQVTPLTVGNETILIVDDEVDLLHLANQYLTELGYKTYLAKDASEAIAIFEKQTDINCLFSDVVMPGGMNGYELADLLTKKDPQLKVLLSSGYASKTAVKNDQARFSSTLLSKPYRKAELAKQLRLTIDVNDHE